MRGANAAYPQCGQDIERTFREGALTRPPYPAAEVTKTVVRSLFATSSSSFHARRSHRLRPLSRPPGLGPATLAAGGGGGALPVGRRKARAARPMPPSGPLLRGALEVVVAWDRRGFEVNVTLEEGAGGM